MDHGLVKRRLRIRRRARKHFLEIQTGAERPLPGTTQHDDGRIGIVSELPLAPLSEATTARSSCLCTVMICILAVWPPTRFSPHIDKMTNTAGLLETARLCSQQRLYTQCAKCIR